MLTPMRDLVPDKKKGIPKSTIIIGLLLGFICAVIIRFIIHGFFFYPYEIKNSLMEPGLLKGQKVTIHHGYDPKDLKRGDILLVQHPAYLDEDRFIIARLIGLPNESIQIDARKIYNNDNLLR